MTAIANTPVHTARTDAGRRLGADISTASTLTEALDLADLNWGLAVQSGNQQMTMLTDDGVITTTIPERTLVMRDDNYTTLGVVGDRYTPVPNKEVFELAAPIVSAGGKYSTAGSLDDYGRRVFMDLRIPEADVAVGGTDLVTSTIRISASHDGRNNVMADLLLTRLICTNGMRARIKGTTTSFKVRHTATASARIAQADSIMRSMVAYSKTFAAVAQEMLDTPFTRAEFGAFIDRMWVRPDTDDQRSLTIWQNRRDALIDLFSFAETNRLGRDTRWGAYNAVTEYLDWAAPVRSKDNDASTQRALRQMADANAEVRNTAFELLATV